MKVLDSTFLIDAIRGKKEANKILDTEKDLITTQMNIYEVVRGLFLEGISASKFHDTIEVFESVRVLQFDEDAMIKSAEISAELIKEGKCLEDSDCIIAGIALSKGISIIITKNKDHFSRIKGIKVETY